MHFASSVQRDRGAAGEAEVAPAALARHPWEEHGFGTSPRGRRFLEALAAMPLLPKLLLGFSVTRCREGDALRRGGSSNVTASVRKLKPLNLVSSLFPIFPIAWQQRWNRFCLSNRFSLKRPITLTGQLAQGQRCRSRGWPCHRSLKVTAGTTTSVLETDGRKVREMQKKRPTHDAMLMKAPSPLPRLQIHPRHQPPQHKPLLILSSGTLCNRCLFWGICTHGAKEIR